MTTLRGIDLSGHYAAVTGSDADLDQALARGALDGVDELVLKGKTTKLPASLGRLRQLRVLVVGKQVKALSDALFECESLETLQLDAKLARLPSGGWQRLGKLTSLEGIGLRALTELPEDLGDAPSLAGALDLRGSKLTTLPDSVARLSRVTELNLSMTKLKTLPRSLAGMTSLEVLTLGPSALAELPEDLGALPRLKRLFAGTAKLKSLPASLGASPTLQRLEVPKNHLTTVPDLGGARSLRVLELSHNPKLTALPSSLSNCPLTLLGLAETGVTELPPSFAKLKLTQVTLPLKHEEALRNSSAAVLRGLGSFEFQ